MVRNEWLDKTFCVCFSTKTATTKEIVLSLGKSSTFHFQLYPLSSEEALSTPLFSSSEPQEFEEVPLLLASSVWRSFCLASIAFDTVNGDERQRTFHIWLFSYTWNVWQVMKILRREKDSKVWNLLSKRVTLQKYSWWKTNLSGIWQTAVLKTCCVTAYDSRW